MIKDYFPNVYLINRDDRKDRLESTIKECKSVNLPFRKVSAIKGEDLDVKIIPRSLDDIMYWNKNSYALLLTTIWIIEDARKNKYNNILILEDDIGFRYNGDIVNKIVDDNIKYIKKDWQMILFGSQNIAEPIMINDNIGIARYSYCCHCYAINSNVYDYYLHCLNKKNKPIDVITGEDIQTLNKTYVFNPGIAIQKADFSNILNQNVDSKL